MEWVPPELKEVFPYKAYNFDYVKNKRVKEFISEYLIFGEETRIVWVK